MIVCVAGRLEVDDDVEDVDVRTVGDDDAEEVETSELDDDAGKVEDVEDPELTEGSATALRTARTSAKM